MKTTLELPDELIREAKLRAVMQGRTLKDLIGEFIRQGLGMAPRQLVESPAFNARVITGEAGLPVIRCRADAQATRTGTVDLLALEQQAQIMEDQQHVWHPV